MCSLYIFHLWKLGSGWVGPASAHPSVLMTGSRFFSSSLSSARSVLKPLSWAPLNSGLNVSSSLRLTKQAVWYQRSIRPSWGFSGSTDFLETRIWSWGDGSEAVRRLSDVKIFSMKRRRATNLFYLLLAAFTRAAVWFGVFHCKFIQRFFSFGASFGAALSCSEEICIEPANVHVAVHLNGKKKTGVLTSSSSSSSHCSATFNGLLHLLLVFPAEVREAADVGGGLSRCSLPEAWEVVPVWDLAVKHGRLRGERKHDDFKNDLTD